MAGNLSYRGDFEGKVVLVAGGTQGVGLRAAELLACRGAKLVVNGRNETRGAEAVAILREITPDARFEAADLTDPDAFAGVVERTVAAFGGLDVLISAGGESNFAVRPFAEFEAEELGETLMNRFLPRAIPVHASLPALRARGGGAIVLLTTDAARHVTAGESIVGAAGAGVILMTKALGRELSRDDIRINAVSMTITSDTPSYDRIFARNDDTRRVFEKAISRFPAGRPPSAREVAEVVAFFASSAAAQVTGQTLSVNGGLSFGGW